MHDASGRQVLKDEERGALVKAGGAGLRANVTFRDGEASLEQMLPLRREAREASKRADALRESVVKSKIALVKTRVALEKKLAASQSGVGGTSGDEQLVAVRKRAGGADASSALLETGDHLRFEMMLPKVCEVDEEIIGLRQSILTSEREARALRVQKNKLDRLAASLKTQRLLDEVLGGSSCSANTLTDEMQKLLWATSRLRSQIESQGEADAGLKVAHLDEFDATKTDLNGAKGSGGGRGGQAERLERGLLLEKTRALQDRVSKFESLLSCDAFFDHVDMQHLVRDYLVESVCSTYRLEVRTATSSEAACDCEVYVSLRGELGSTDRELLYNAEYADQTFPRGSRRFFEIRTLHSVGTLRSVTLWLGSTGTSSTWLLEDLCVVDVKAGSACFFPCGYLVRGQVTLESEVLQGCYCVYEVTARAVAAPPDSHHERVAGVAALAEPPGAKGGDGAGSIGGRDEEAIPHTLELMMKGQAVGDAREHEQQLVVTLDQDALVPDLDQADSQLATLRHRHRSRRTSPATSAAAGVRADGARSALQMVQRRWRVRASYLGRVTSVAILSMVPNKKWSLGMACAAPALKRPPSSASRCSHANSCPPSPRNTVTWTRVPRWSMGCCLI